MSGETETPVLCIASGWRPFPSGYTSALRSTGGEVSILGYSVVQRCGGRLTAGCGYRAVQVGARSTSASRSTGGEVSILAYSVVQRCGGGLTDGGDRLTAGCGYRAVQAGAQVVMSTVAAAGWDHGAGITNRDAINPLC
jgi:hypothetical protein